MNFLAHIYLSGNSREILIGNFIGDYVKGNKHADYPTGIQQGILLHRYIDTFTDKHPVTRNSKKFVSERYRKHSGIVVDVFYDHFLSANWGQYSDISLTAYVRDRYKMLNSGFSYFPQGVKSWFPHFIKSNWLKTYASLEGLAMVFTQMSYRTSLPEHSDYAVSQLIKHYDELKSGFFSFFGEICQYVQSEYDIRLDD